MTFSATGWEEYFDYIFPDEAKPQVVFGPAAVCGAARVHVFASAHVVMPGMLTQEHGRRRSKFWKWPRSGRSRRPTSQLRAAGSRGGSSCGGCDAGEEAHGPEVWACARSMCSTSKRGRVPVAVVQGREVKTAVGPVAGSDLFWMPRAVVDWGCGLGLMLVGSGAGREGARGDRRG